MASLTGPADALAGFLAAARLPASAEVLGPVPAGPELERFLVRAPRAAWPGTVAALKAAAGVRSAHKDAGSVRLQVDPLEIA
jgi:primosomal protein N' (replication factor Y)